MAGMPETQELLRGIQNEAAENTMRMFSLKRQLGLRS